MGTFVRSVLEAVVHLQCMLRLEPLQTHLALVRPAFVVQQTEMLSQVFPRCEDFLANGTVMLFIHANNLAVAGHVPVQFSQFRESLVTLATFKGQAGIMPGLHVNGQAFGSFQTLVANAASEI